MTIKILPTRNTDWGFWGTIDRSVSDRAGEATDAWELASQAIAARTGASPEAVRDFLDSRHGRHFADEVANKLFRGRAMKEAIDAAVARWMEWKIDRPMSRETGIPRGLPYLTGLVTHFDILAEADA